MIYETIERCTKYYRLHINIPKNGYSIGIKSYKPLTMEEAKYIAIEKYLFKDDSDFNFVDSIDEMTKEEFEECYE